MSRTQQRIGFIGLGIMGKAMATNLLNAGYSLVVHDLNAAPVREVVAMGAECAESPHDVAQRCTMIITMLPDWPQVKGVVLGDNGILAGASPGTLVVDMSSINPVVTVELAEVAKTKGVRMIDAPVSGGEPSAIAGTLAIMVGGEKEDVEACKEILSRMGKSVVHAGAIGAGQTTKLVNQIIVALNLAAIGEAFTLGVKAGVAPEAIYQAIRGGLAGSNALEQKAAKIMAGDFKPGFRINLHIKDLNNALAAADSLGVPLILTSLVNQMLKHLKQRGEGDNDHCGVIRFMEELACVEVRAKKEPKTLT